MKNILLTIFVWILTILTWVGLIGCFIFGFLFLSDTSNGLTMLLFIGSGLMFWCCINYADYIGDYILSNKKMHKKYDATKKYPKHTPIKNEIIKTEETCKGCGAPLKTCTCDYCGRKIGNYRVIYTSLA